MYVMSLPLRMRVTLLVFCRAWTSAAVIDCSYVVHLKIEVFEVLSGKAVGKLQWRDVIAQDEDI